MPHVASTTNLRTGRVKSCGCLRRRAPLTVAEQRERLEVDIARLQKKLAELSEMDEAPQ
jgi:DNA-binding MarR family transcriptional regulator